MSRHVITPRHHYPVDFGKFRNDLLAGNFGNGRIHAFDPAKFNGLGEFQHRSPFHAADGQPIQIEGLWALAFGRGAPANGPAPRVYTP